MKGLPEAQGLITINPQPANHFQPKQFNYMTTQTNTE